MPCGCPPPRSCASTATSTLRSTRASKPSSPPAPKQPAGPHDIPAPSGSHSGSDSLCRSWLPLLTIPPPEACTPVPLVSGHCLEDSTQPRFPPLKGCRLHPPDFIGPNHTGDWRAIHSSGSLPSRQRFAYLVYVLGFNIFVAEHENCRGKQKKCNNSEHTPSRKLQPEHQ